MSDADDRGDAAPREASHRPEPDLAADTAMFQAFQDADPDADREAPRATAPFAIVTLLIGLAFFAGIAWLLLQ